MTTYYTSDLHLGHRNIIEYCERPWADVLEMDDALIWQWQDTVGPEDTIYHVGDMTLGGPNILLGYLKQLTGRIKMIAGNHDLKALKKLAAAWLLPENVEYLGKEAIVTLGHQDMKLFHYPEPPYARLDRGLIHGHTHGQGAWHTKAVKEPGTVDVCWDIHKKILTSTEVLELWKAGQE